MKTELIYVWINQDEHNCFHPMDFNFSPEYIVHFNFDERILTMTQTGCINVFKSKNTQNLTAIIGENGTGKTTLLQYLTSLTNFPIQDPKHDEYFDYLVNENEKKKFIAVYIENNSSYKILNATDFDIAFEGETIEPYSQEDFRENNYTNKISHIYLSNSEYVQNINMRSDAIEYITLSNSALRGIFKDFYARLLYYPRGGLILNTKFNALQSMIIKKTDLQKAQMILDVVYQQYISQNNKVFLGKKLTTVYLSVADVCGLINNEVQSASYTTAYTEKEFISSVHLKMSEEKAKIRVTNEKISKCVSNLIFELLFSFDNFTLDGNELSCEDAYEQCRKYILGLSEEVDHKKYYEAALEELDGFFDLCASYNLFENGLPPNDLARHTFLEMNVDDVYKIIDNAINKGSSFLLKYLQIHNLEMSSGERALMNLMSRILFASNISRFMADNRFKLQDNVLLLIDEIDLYLHPEWQRRIIWDLLDSIENIFPDKTFQIVISSHSPIVLSDIPSENTIYLKRENGEVVQRRTKTQTFGANIHTLYKDSFFIKNGLAMGEFARRYINNLIDRVKKGEVEKEDLERQIDLIGEPILRKKLKQFADAPLVATPISTSERTQMIDFLKHQKEAIEIQIALLEREADV